VSGEPLRWRREAVKGRILVVDDQDANRLLMRDLLESQGHEVLEATDGTEALRRVGEAMPDVVLLDIGMPGMDGFEVCRRLKADPVTASIPVLLVTAMTQRDQRLLGIGAGANDYITKPVDRSDLSLRVGNAIRMRHLYLEVEAQYRQLEKLELLRDSLVHMIVHDLRSPLAGIRAYLDLVKMDGAGKLDLELTQSIDAARKVAVEMTDMVSDLLDVSRLEVGKMPLELAPADMGGLVVEAVAAAGASPRVRIRVEPPADKLRVVCDAGVIRRVLTNLISNAVKFTPSSGQVAVSARGNGSEVKVEVVDTGPGIPPEYHQKVFEKYGQVEAARHGAKHSTGLGLTFCKLAVEAHGGQVGLESAVGTGSTFWIVLPVRGPVVNTRPTT
jgi:two-component system, sensor histidine kinase and response regulator